MHQHSFPPPINSAYFFEQVADGESDIETNVLEEDCIVGVIVTEGEAPGDIIVSYEVYVADGEKMQDVACAAYHMTTNGIFADSLAAALDTDVRSLSVEHDGTGVLQVSDSQCLCGCPVTECSSEEFVVVEATPSTDRVCDLLSECNVEEYEIVAPYVIGITIQTYNTMI